MLVPFDEKMKDIANKIKEFIKIINVDSDGNVNIFSDKGLKHNGEHVYGAKVLYDNTSGTTGTVTLNESAANFEYIEIYAGYSDIWLNACLKVYRPDGKTVDVSSANAGGNNLQATRTRCDISGTSIAQSYNYNTAYRNTGSFIATPNIFYIKLVIGYR